jgi:hypothetical protein
MHAYTPKANEQTLQYNARQVREVLRVPCVDPVLHEQLLQQHAARFLARYRRQSLLSLPHFREIHVLVVVVALARLQTDDLTVVAVAV